MVSTSATARHPDVELVARCADRDRVAQRELTLRLLPVLRMQIAVLDGHMAHTSTGSSDRKDLLQDVLLELLRNGAQELRRWKPERGLSLEGFVRLVARRFVARKLARRSRDRQRFLATAPDVVDMEPVEACEGEVARRHDLDLVLRELYARMSERDRVLFDRLIVEECTVADVAAELGMTLAAVKKWRTRIYGRAKQVAAEVRVPRTSATSASNARPVWQGQRRLDR